jgi:homoserine kinase
MQLKNIQSLTAFAPATCGNVIVGFDILGLAISNVGDKVTLTRRDDDQITIEKIDSADPLPTDPQKNVAAVVIDKMRHALDIKEGFSIHLQKGIALSSGMGGSAASGVAALTALNGFLEQPLSLEELANFAMAGEALSSGQAHSDNLVPALYGGITLTQQADPIKVIQLPVPDIYCVIVHPHLQLATRDARNALSATIPLSTHIQQSTYIATFISGLYQNDIGLIKDSLKDVVIEPQRAKLIVGFDDVKAAALEDGALGVSISGAGPSMIAFAVDATQAAKIGNAMRQAFAQHNVDSDVYVSPVSDKGASVI